MVQDWEDAEQGSHSPLTRPPSKVRFPRDPWRQHDLLQLRNSLAAGLK